VEITPNDYPYPEQKLDYSGNVLNALAARFYRRHGVKEIGRAAEAGADLAGKALMTTKFCLRRQYGLCKKGKEVEPLYLEDGEGSRFRLEFDCAACLMKLYFEGKASPEKESK
jgi:putative protease